MNAKTTLPTNSEERKNYPLMRGCLRYFAAALAGVANISKLGNDKHNPGQELHHARGKSTDHGDCVIRHLMDVSDMLAAIERGHDVSKEAVLLEVNQFAWRALAFSQEVHEQFGAPMAPGAKVETIVATLEFPRTWPAMDDASLATETVSSKAAKGRAP